MCEQPKERIVTFKHCSNEHRVFCFEIPDRCPICQQPIKPSSYDPDMEHQTEMLVRELESLPSPLKSATEHRCALAIRPTKGDFLSDYKNTSDLHICLTMSDGRIVEFDAKGCRISQDLENEWHSCLIINMLDYLPSKVINNIWDQKLEKFCQNNDRWSRESYHPIENNCFDFVLEYLRSLNLRHFEPSIRTKTKFCETFLVPRTKLLARYISLYRKIRSEKFVILGP